MLTRSPDLAAPRRLAALAVAAILVAMASAQTETVGTLSTSAGDSVTQSQLAAWIDEFIPGTSQRLVVLTQCFGGDTAKAFAGKANTAVGSATSPGQEAIYGGYDDDAAGALKPGAGRTGQTVHDAGVGGKDPSETPSTAGGLGLGSFSLEDTAAAGNVQSRHVLVYAGQPDSTPGRDVTQRDTIKGNFAGQTNTTVTTVGGGGGGGWDHAGSAAGLRKALKEIGDAISGAPNPDKEQFVLFVTDHGDLHRVAAATTGVPPGGPTPVTPTGGLECFRTAIDLDPDTLTNDPLNVTGWSVFVDFQENGVQHEEGSGPFFSPGQWAMQLMLGTDTLVLNSFFDVFVELDIDDSGIIGDSPGEGVRLFFPMDETQFIGDYFDAFVEIALLNNTGRTWIVRDPSQDTGDIAKVPEPGGALPLLIIVAGLVRRRRGRPHQARRRH